MGKMINMEIKSNTLQYYSHQRWMRCISSNDLENYVDIAISPGSSGEERLAVLEIADFLGGVYNSPAMSGKERVKYNYYYLYFRNKGYYVDDINFQEMNEEKAKEDPDYKFKKIGFNRHGDMIYVDIRTNTYVIKESKEEMIKRYAEFRGRCNQLGK